MIRAYSALMLSFVLALTSHSAGMAKASPMAVDQMVICTGLGATVIYMDADGQPTAAPHICPDCLVHLDDIDLRAVETAPTLLPSHLRARLAGSDVTKRAHPTHIPPARGPPVLI